MKTAVAAILAMALTAMPVASQVRTIDPNAGIDADVAPGANRSAPVAPVVAPVRGPDVPPPSPAANRTAPAPVPPPSGEVVQQARAEATTAAADTYKRDDLIGAGEDVFGKGAEGFAGLIEKILKEQGEPNAYIAGREASAALVVGLRYGSGIMTHKVEGQRPVYWTGPSVGFDAGGDANKVFVLVYNLNDTQELFKRFPGAEGRLYFVGGFAATYLRSGNTVLIPVRLGVGWRAGVNVGYMKFTEKSKWMPF
ncbi:hypothetical protein ASG29_08560 [Sphingomonas sp. Leaf412]|uniref:DUF1134 domain-containing protein n=1 Tax=Sphingomonas sp. Leaf412 TaxID=1736370 RepID=UPI0006FFE861|nr:DUF1134 domain-containing protein [Sphingomonas sp. Leaf412]KQT31919.1 hypothetical protein ASG29_08560 [Sphingomonas sp. Leaf412]